MTAAAPDGLAIDLRHVTKVYGRKIHARGINMQVRRGEVFGLLGPNGAGKSTLVKIMMTVIRPTRAEGTVLGDRVGQKSTMRRIGYLPENHRFPRHLTGRQTVEFFGALAGVDRRRRNGRAAELLDLVGMADAADRKIATYSKGMAQRTGLAQALVNDPDLVVLDEPTDGVDPGGRRDIREVLERMRREGKTVFVNSHLLSELEVIADRVAILVGGQVARQGTIDELTVAKQRYEIDLMPAPGQSLQHALATAMPGAVPAVAAAPAAPAGVLPYQSGPALPPALVLRGTLPSGHWTELEGTTLRVGTVEAADVQPLVDACRGAGLVIRRLQSVRPSLEDLFVEAVAKPGNGANGGGLGMIGQTLAIFLDAYRELNSKRMFWIVLAISALVVLVFAAAGIDAQGQLTLLGMQTPIPIAMPPDEFYKLMFVTFGIEIWLALAATVLAIISTASIFPDLLTGGSIDLYLSKPLGRLRLFLTKYAAALLFVTLQVAVFCVASFVIIGVRGGAWEPRILLGVPIVVCFFSYLYAVSVLFGVLTRSTIAAILLTVLAWFLIFVVHGSEIALLTFRTAADRQAASAAPTLKVVEGQLVYLEKRPPAELTATENEMLTNLRRQRDELRDNVEGRARRNLDLAHRIVYGFKTALPKTSETTALLSRSLMPEPEYDAAEDGPRPDNNRRRRERPITRDDERAVQSAVRQRPVSWVVGTSLLFEAVVLGLAAWVFCRRDY